MCLLANLSEKGSRVGKGWNARPTSPHVSHPTPADAGPTTLALPPPAPSPGSNSTAPPGGGGGRKWALWKTMAIMWVWVVHQHVHMWTACTTGACRLREPR